MPAITEVKEGFWVGLGVVLALMVWAAVQMAFAKGARRHG
jgi:hypothetical protein